MLIDLNKDNQDLVDKLKNNRKIVSLEINNEISDDRSIALDIAFLKEDFTSKVESDFIPTMLENRFIDFGNKQVVSHKRRVAPFDVVKESIIQFSVPVEKGSQETLRLVLENLQNFIEEN